MTIYCVSMQLIYVIEKLHYKQKVLLHLIFEDQAKILLSRSTQWNRRLADDFAETASIFKLCRTQVLCSCLQARGKNIRFLFV